MRLRAGAVEVNITPPVGCDMTGFGGRPSGCTGIHDDLYAKALLLDGGERKVAIITSDLLSLDFDLVAKVRQLIEEQTGIAGCDVMINSSHTHSGPASITLRGLGYRDEAYCDVLVRKIAGAVYVAANNLVEAKLGVGREPVQVGINRRQITPDRGMILGKSPERPIAPYVDVLRVDREDGRPLAILFNHAAHPVVLGGANLLISADYPGYAMGTVKNIFRDVGRAASLPEDVVAMFAQGCCGNINSDPVGRTFDDARRLGVRLGAAVAKCAEMIETTSNVDHLDSIQNTIQLPLQTPLPLEEAEKTANDLEEAWKRTQRETTHQGQLKIAKANYEWASDMLALSKEGKAYLTQDFEIHALRINDTAIVGLPGEVFVEYALHIDKNSPFCHTFVFGYTNGCIGYVPDEKSYPEGGYEVAAAYKYYGTLMLKPQSDKLIRDAAAQTLAELSDGKRESEERTRE